MSDIVGFTPFYCVSCDKTYEFPTYEEAHQFWEGHVVPVRYRVGRGRWQVRYEHKGYTPQGNEIMAVEA